MTWRTPGNHERTAAAFEDLASALDAGLSPAEAFAEPGSRPNHGAVPVDPIGALEARGLELDPIERRTFEAAVQAGELPRTLRERAAGRMFFASLQREVLAALAYPLFLTCLAIGVASLVSSIGSGPSVLIGFFAGLLGLLAGLALLLARARSHVELPWLLRPIRKLLLDSGEIPYLSGLAALYGAGIPVLEAHALAGENAPIGAVRARMFAATTLLERDRTSLVGVLTQCRALDPETLRILAPAESAGDLEDGLQRAITRRRDVFARRAKRTARTIGFLAYGTAVLVVAYVVIDFYSSLYSLRR